MAAGLSGVVFRVRAHEARTVKKLDSVFAFPNFDPFADESPGGGIAMSSYGHIPFDVYDAMVELINLGDEGGKRSEPSRLQGEQLARSSVEVALERRVGLVTEVDRALIERGQAGELATGHEVVLDIAHGPLDPRGAIRISLLMRLEDKAESVGERFHLRRGGHLGTRTAGHDYRCIVDHTHRAGSTEVLEGFGEKELAIESIESRIALEEHHSRKAQHHGGGLHLDGLAQDTGGVGRRIVLHLLTGVELIVACGLNGPAADAVPTAKGGQRRVGNLGATGKQLFVNPYQVAFTACVELQNLFPIGFGLLGT